VEAREEAEFRSRVCSTRQDLDLDHRFPDCGVKNSTEASFKDKGQCFGHCQIGLLVSLRCGRTRRMSIESLRQLPRIEKLKLMEMLWDELSRPDDKFESPAWHAQELAATERRLPEGKEQVLDWDAAKESLRSKFR
jgi:hypothetical protein